MWKAINTILTFIKDKPLWFIILILMIIVVIKQQQLEKERDKPIKTKIEVVYDNTIQTIDIDIPKDPEFILKPSEIYIDSVDINKELTKEDSIKIFSELLDKYKDYISEKKYSGIVKDDSSMFISYNALIQYNKLKDLQFITQNKYPYKEIQKVEINPIRILGGVGIYGNDLNAQIGFINRKGSVFEINYGVTNKTIGFGLKTTLFKIK